MIRGPSHSGQLLCITPLYLPYWISFSVHLLEGCWLGFAPTGNAVMHALVYVSGRCRVAGSGTSCLFPYPLSQLCTRAHSLPPWGFRGGVTLPGSWMALVEPEETCLGPVERVKADRAVCLPSCFQFLWLFKDSLAHGVPGDLG